jgi:predicted transcriptional regulator
MEKIGEYLVNQRLRRQLVYPFLEIDYQPLKDRLERKLIGEDMVEVIERAGELASTLKKDSSNVYKSLQKLTCCGICIKEKTNI